MRLGKPLVGDTAGYDQIIIDNVCIYVSESMQRFDDYFTLDINLEEGNLHARLVMRR